MAENNSDYTYDDLDLIFQNNEIQEEEEIDLCDLICNGPEEVEE